MACQTCWPVAVALLTEGLRARWLPYHLVMSAGGLDTAWVSPAFTAQDAARFRAAGWWSDSTLSDAVRRNAEQSPDRLAYSTIPVRR